MFSPANPRTPLLKETQKTHSHDTHAIPPQAVCNAYKNYQKLDDLAVDEDLQVLDFRRGLTSAQKEKLVAVGTIPSESIESARKAFNYDHKGDLSERADTEPSPAPCTVYEHKDFPGTTSPIPTIIHVI